ncbi:MAG: carbonic anhydrase [Nanoarchaeota archaeon]
MLNKVEKEIIEKNREFEEKHKLKSFNEIINKAKETFEKGQKPKTILITCSDSRVLEEIALEELPGEVFTIRTAGQVLGEEVFETIYYGLIHLNVKEIIVLGHNKCGAVNATKEIIEKQQEEELFLFKNIVRQLERAIFKAKEIKEEFENKYEIINIFNIMDYLAKDPIIRKVKPKISGFIYHLEDLKVEYIAYYNWEKEKIIIEDEKLREKIKEFSF